MLKSSLDYISEFEDLIFKIELNTSDEKIKKYCLEGYDIATRFKQSKAGKKPMTMLYSEDLERLYSYGFTVTQIAVITGIKELDIRKYFKRRGINE